MPITDVPLAAFAEGSKADGFDRAAGEDPLVLGKPGSGPVDFFDSNTSTPPAQTGALRSIES